MSTRISDSHVFYGRYVRKSDRAVPWSVAREIERTSGEYITKCSTLEGEICRAHQLLDRLGAPRLQPSGFTYSLEGRLSILLCAKADNG